MQFNILKGLCPEIFTRKVFYLYGSPMSIAINFLSFRIGSKGLRDLADFGLITVSKTTPTNWCQRNDTRDQLTPAAEFQKLKSLPSPVD
jgi:hypothetical protein